jgi:hypothetical protein
MDRTRLFTIRAAGVPVLIGIVAILAIHPFFGSFRALVLLAGFVLLADLASLSRGRLRDIFVVFASVAFGSIAIESAALIVEPKISKVISEGLYASKSVVGWGPSHVGRYHDERTEMLTGRTIYNVNYTIDQHFLRQTDSTTFGPAIVFFGDSLTFGNGVNDIDTLPQQFADLLDHRVRVLNLAYGGYGPSQFLRIMQENMFHTLIGTRPKVFVFMTAAWHAERNACKSEWARRAPRFVLEREQLVLAGTCRDAQNILLRDWLGGYATFRRFVEPLLLRATDEDIELYIRTLLEAVHLAEEKYGTRTIIPYLRDAGYLRSTTRFTDDIVMARLREGGALVVDASLRSQEKAGAVLTIRGDGHPTPLGHRLRARMLKEYLAQHMASALVSNLGNSPR